MSLATKHVRVFVSYSSRGDRDLAYHTLRPTGDNNREDGFLVLYEDALKEIGTKGVEQLCALQRYLYGNESPSDLRFRLAPSIVARSEAEFFGLSNPRFAIRVYLDKAGDSFVNARRLQFFSREFRVHVPPPYKDYATSPDRNSYASLPGEMGSTTELLADANCIGDSLLVPPRRLTTKYHCLTVELGRVYGEGKPIRGTPFVQDIAIGGAGLCAQAACFMALALLHNDPDGCDVKRQSVYSPAEVSFLAAEHGASECVLTPLTSIDISRFVRAAIGGNPLWQTSVATCAIEDGISRFAAALRAYLLAGIPIILSTKKSRLAGHELGAESTIYASNGLRIGRVPRRASEAHGLDHVILLVGCGRAIEDKDQFLLNDSATFPFLQASAQQLWSVAEMTDSASCDSKNCSFLPVTPSRIRMPLEAWYDKDNTPRAGLSAYADAFVRWITEGYVRSINLPKSAGTGGTVRSWLLRYQDLKDISASNATGSNILSDILGATGITLEAALPRALAAIASSADHGHWIWLQYRKDNDGSQSLWIWDAEGDPPSYTMSDKNWVPSGEQLLIMPLGVSHYKDRKWTELWVSIRADVSSSAPLEHRHEMTNHFAESILKPALITSFMPERVLGYWPNDVACELDLSLCLQSTFLENALNPGSKLRREPVSTIELLCELANDASRLRAVARAFAKWADSREIKIIAMSTLMPEIQNIDERSVTLVPIALGAAGSLAVELQSLGHPTSVVQLVGGTRIRGIWPYRRMASMTSKQHTEGYAASLSSTSEVIKTLCARLRSAVRQMSVIRRDERPISFAVELEPGPLFAINNLEGLMHLCESLDRDSELSPVVGLNLDIAHWMLAGIAPTSLSNVKERIIHCHISDHGRGHFGDCPPGEVGLGQNGAIFEDRLRAFMPWIHLLREIAAFKPAQPRMRPAFSGRISLELEGCRSMAMVATAVESLTSLIASK